MNETKQSDRKLARQRQLELMEAAAGGVPSRQVDLLDDNQGEIHFNPTGALSQENVANARRLLFDDEEDVNLVPSTPTRQPAFPPPPSSGSLFERREYPVDQSVNLMDPQSSFGGQDERSGFLRSLSNRIPVFRPTTGQEAHLEHDAAVSMEADEFLGEVDKRREPRIPTMMTILLQRKRLVCAVLTFFLLILAIATLSGGKGGDPKEITRDDQFRKVIVESGVTSEARLHSHLSSSAKAFTWIVHRDPAKLEPSDPFVLQRYALATLFYETAEYQDTPDPLGIGKNWMSGNGICSWGGVECSDQAVTDDGDVVHLNLPENELRGTIPPELVALSKLTMLDLSRNELNRGLPTELAKLTTVELILLERNALTGSIPKEYSKLASITDFHVGSNLLSGTITKELNRLTTLQSLGLDENHLTGTIPDLSALSNLEALYLDDNHLSGELPDSMSLLTSLTDLRLRMNSLIGPIPSSWSALTNLEVVYIDNNEFRGPPATVLFENAPNLAELHLYENDMTGSIPASIGNSSSLRVLYMDSNELTGHIPTEIGNLGSMEALFLSGNQLHGPIPTEIGNIGSSLRELRMFSNQLTGEVPSEIGKLENLERLHLQTNSLDGPLPVELGHLSHLRSCRLYENIIIGHMPSQVCALKTENGGQLEFLAVDCNQHFLITCSCCEQCYPLSQGAN